MILLWGLLEDATTRAVFDHLIRWRARLAFVDHAAVERARVVLTAGPRVLYRLTSSGRDYELDDATAAYLRPYAPRDYGPPDAGEHRSGEISRPELVHHVMHAWAEGSSALVINRPSAEATNHSKLRQAMLISASGFLVPDSMVTNDVVRIREFQARHGGVIYKSMSSVRSIVKELRATDLDAVEKLGPVFLQRRILGQNVRVHVVGDETFGCAVHSDGVDYRYAESKVEAVSIPSDVAARSVTLARRLGLILAGIDLIVTPRGDWYCFEVNTNPAFSYYDASEDQVIAGAVAKILMRGNGL